LQYVILVEQFLPDGVRDFIGCFQQFVRLGIKLEQVKNYGLTNYDKTRLNKSYAEFGGKDMQWQN